MSRKKNQLITAWGEQHKTFVTEWNRRRWHKDGERRVIDWDDYAQHMRWYDDGQKHRLRLRPRWTTEDIAEPEMDDPEEEAYQGSIRDMSGFREFSPLINRVVSSSILNRRWYVIHFIHHCGLTYAFIVR